MFMSTISINQVTTGHSQPLENAGSVKSKAKQLEPVIAKGILARQEAAAPKLIEKPRSYTQEPIQQELNNLLPKDLVNIVQEYAKEEPNAVESAEVSEIMLILREPEARRCFSFIAFILLVLVLTFLAILI